ncbi:FAD dependent oxidoreductase [Xylariomycetidae sp. FL0641]|nr:FAD dependent oxidoreductase [Xylariomycetidae sp. FL0641]
MPAKTSSIVIVGAGVFGLSLALELCKRGYRNVTVLDRSRPPVPDGSSVDISRIVRSDYADPVYMKMAVEAVTGWKSEYSRFYHESGILIISGQGGNAYLDKAKDQVQSQGGQIRVFKDASSIREGHREFAGGDLRDCAGYMNPRGAWVDSADAVRELATKCEASGVSFLTGPRGSVQSLLCDGTHVVGVNVCEGGPVLADHVVLATGAWTSRLIDVSSSANSTAQPVGFTQLSAEEAVQLRGMPVAINLDTGFFVFPPTPGSNLLKCARHGYGYETRVLTTDATGAQRHVSAPGMHCNDTRPVFLPQDAEASLREGLRQFAPPSISERPFANKVLCWYTDTPESDFIVDHHSDLQNLFLVTGGSGHAFKFLPVLGSYTCDIFEGKASDTLRTKWAFKPGDENVLMHGDGSRGGPPKRCLETWEQLEIVKAEELGVAT